MAQDALHLSPVIRHEKRNKGGVMVEVLASTMLTVLAMGALSAGTVALSGPIKERMASHRSEEEEGRKRAMQLEERHRERIRENPLDYIQSRVSVARAQAARLVRDAVHFEEEAEEALQLQMQEVEQLGELLPSTAVRVKNGLMFVLWLVSVVASVVLTFQLAHGITNNVVLSLPISLILVTFIEMGSIKIHTLIESHKAGEVNEVKWKVSWIAVITLTILFIVFAVALSYIRADLIVTAAEAANKASLSAVETQIQNGLAKGEDVSQFEYGKTLLDQTANELRGRRTQETMLFAFAEGIAVPLELVTGMVIPQVALITGHRKKIRKLKAKESEARKAASGMRDSVQEIEDRLVVELEEFCLEHEIPLSSIQEFETSRTLTAEDPGMRLDGVGGGGGVVVDDGVEEGGSEANVSEAVRLTEHPFGVDMRGGEQDWRFAESSVDTSNPLESMQDRAPVSLVRDDDDL